MALWQYLLLFLAVLLGGGMAQFTGERGRTYLPYLLSFSGAYLLGIAAMELIPDVFSGEVAEPGIWLLGGFFVQLVLEGFSQGVEHGHIHAHRRANYGYAVQIMIGLGLHALLEGLPLGVSNEDYAHGEHLLFGIILHKLPAAFALGLLLRASGYSRRVTWTCLLIFALLSPAGALSGELLSIDPVWRIRILALVVGSFLHISTTILFEADGPHRHAISPRKFAVIVIGMAVAYFTAH